MDATFNAIEVALAIFDFFLALMGLNQIVWFSSTVKRLFLQTIQLLCAVGSHRSCFVHNVDDQLHVVLELQK